MSFLRRLFGGDGPGTPASETVDAGDAQPHADADPDDGTDAAMDAEADTAEQRRELDLLRDEQARLDDLAQRQLRYARFAWQPPAEGGERRAEDTSEGAQVPEPTGR